MKIYVADGYSGFKGIVKVRKKKYHTPLEEIQLFEERYFYDNYAPIIKSIEKHTGISFIDRETFNQSPAWLFNDIFGSDKEIFFLYVR